MQLDNSVIDKIIDIVRGDDSSAAARELAELELVFSPGDSTQSRLIEQSCAKREQPATRERRKAS